MLKQIVYNSEQLAKDAPRTRADRQADANLVQAAGGSGHEQIREVHAGNEQD
jgi:hypothetical protein